MSLVIMPDNSELLLGIHSNSLSEATKSDKEVVDVLFECARMKECLGLAAPAADASVLLTLDQSIVRLSYEDRGDGSFVARREKERIGFHYSIPPSMIQDLYDCKEDSRKFREIKGAFLDLLAFEAISRWHKNESIFVSQSPHLLEKQVWILARFDVKVLSFVQALEYFDLYLKRRDIYYVNPHITQVDGKAFDYWFLLKDLVPEFAEAWRTIIYGQKIIQNAQNIQDGLAGLADRFQNAFCASDRISMEYMKRPVNSTEWEMLYNFNYFCMLATGIFDSLAWLTVYRYSIPVHHPIQVSIRVTTSKSKGTRFVKKISQHNSSLESLIKTQQVLINLFYPMRDATQHREPVGGTQFVHSNEGWTASLARVKQDAAVAVQNIDQLGYPFTKWGLLKIAGIDYFLEPYRFSRQALRKLLTFTNEYLKLLDLPSLIASDRDMVKKIADARSKEPEPPFIARIYWRRDSHLPILFRNR